MTSCYARTRIATLVKAGMTWRGLSEDASTQVYVHRTISSFTERTRGLCVPTGKVGIRDNTGKPGPWIHTHAPYRNTISKGLTLKQVLASLRRKPSYDSVFRILRTLKYFRSSEVEREIKTVLEAFDALFERVKGGSELNIPIYLYLLGVTARAHPPFRELLLLGPSREKLDVLYEKFSKRPALFSSSFYVSNMVCSQYSLGYFSGCFWRDLPLDSISDWNARAAANVVYAYGQLYRLGCTRAADGKELAILRTAVLTHSHRFTSQGVANAAWSLAAQNLLCHEMAAPLRCAVARLSSELEPSHVPMILWAFGETLTPLEVAEEPLLHSLERGLPDMDARAVANSAVACSRLGVNIFNRVPFSEAVVRVARDMTPQAVSMTVHAYAKINCDLGVTHDPLMAAIRRTVEEMSSQMSAKVLWALGRLNLRNNIPLPCLLDAVKRNSPMMNAQEVSNVFWALARMGELGSWKESLIEILRIDGRWSSQALANIFWALGTSRVSLGEHDQLLCAAIPDVALAMKPQEVANTIWGAAHSGISLYNVREPLVDAMERTAGGMTVQGLANSAWGLSRAGFTADDVPHLFLNRIVGAVGEMEAIEVVQCIDAVVSLGIPYSVACEPVLEAVVRVSPHLSYEGMAIVLEALVQLRVGLGSSHDPLLEVIARTVGHLNHPAVTNAAIILARRGGSLGVVGDEVCQALVKVSDQITLTCSTHIFRAVTKMSEYSLSSPESGFSGLLSVVESMTPWECSVTVWAVAKLQHMAHTQIFIELQNVLMKFEGTFSNPQLALIENASTMLDL